MVLKFAQAIISHPQIIQQNTQLPTIYECDCVKPVFHLYIMQVFFCKLQL